MIRAITMLRVADCYGPMPYSQVKKGNFYVAYDTEEQVYKNIMEDFASAANVLYNYYKGNGICADIYLAAECPADVGGAFRQYILELFATKKVK